MLLAMSQVSASRWFGPAGSPAGDAQVFVFPYAGGVAASFAQWRELAAPELSVQVALMPGRGARLHEPPVDDLAELVDALATAVVERASGPFLLFGHSLGALVAFEVTRELRRRGAPAPLALLVGGAEAPQTRLVRRRVHDLDDAGLIEALRDFGATPAALLADRDLMELILPGYAPTSRCPSGTPTVRSRRWRCRCTCCSATGTSTWTGTGPRGGPGNVSPSRDGTCFPAGISSLPTICRKSST